MEHVQSMRLVDLTAAEPDDASPKLRQRRALLRTAGMAAFAASTTGSAFAQTLDRYDPGATSAVQMSVLVAPDPVPLGRIGPSVAICSVVTSLPSQLPVVHSSAGQAAQSETRDHAARVVVPGGM